VWCISDIRPGGEKERDTVGREMER
jgi:hypothetical protein